jgi:hypothetical protein
MDWKEFLLMVSKTLISSNELLESLKESNDSTWLGYKGASENEIMNHEDRLQTTLPPSYKEFLKVSNGFKQLHSFVWDILPVENIDWIKNYDPSFYELYANNLYGSFNTSDEEYFVYGENQRSTDFRSSYLIESLVVSNWGDSSIVLLNPNVKFGEEWEVWVFTVWSYGPTRYKSFEELMQQEYASFIKLLKDNS